MRTLIGLVGQTATWRMRALRVLIVAAAVLWPKSAVAYTIVTQLFYNAPTATLAGYSATYKDPWDGTAGYYYDSGCECWFYWEDWASVQGGLFDPSNQLVAIAYWRDFAQAVIELPAFRPGKGGQWRAAALHYFETDWYDEDGCYWCTGCYSWCYVFTDTFNLGQTSWTANVTCVVPTSETTTSGGWDDGGRGATVHRFNQSLYPSTAAYRGPQVREQQPGDALDSCWFPGSGFAKAGLGGGSDTWTVSTNGTYGPDFVGWGEDAVTYYRAQGRAPCEAAIPQQMVFVCADGNEFPYALSTMRWLMDATSVGSERTGVRVARTWPGGAPPPPPPPPPGGPNTLQPTERLYSNQYRDSANGQYRLVYQGDGNFVLYAPGGPTWATMTLSSPGRAEMQTDGNLVVYDASDTPLWHSATNGNSGAWLLVQDDGRIVIYGSGGQALWSRP